MLLFRRKDELGIDSSGSPAGDPQPDRDAAADLQRGSLSRAGATARDLRIGRGDRSAVPRFDWFVLSDTTDPAIWIAEEKCFLQLRHEVGTATRFFYRHRPENTARKSGNIEDWIKRFGADYECMLILDADSLMTGDTIVRLVAAMEHHPKVALIQTLPIVVNARSLFARWQQFAGRLYGPLMAAGIAWWHGSEGNYWGHNAIIRVRAFAQYAGLPELRGPQAVRRTYSQP